MNKVTFPRLQIGVSQCLLGEKVRFDGGHKRDRFIVNSLCEFADFVPVCPEVGAGLGIPRPPIQLNKSSGTIRVVEIKNPQIDVTEQLVGYSKSVLDKFSRVHGFILKSKSPSCGMERVNIRNAKGQYEKKGVGVFAHELMQRYPCLPVEEEGRLCDHRIRDNFITRLYVYQRWQAFIDKGASVKGLIEFHQHHKLLLMAHNLAAYRRLGRVVANTSNASLQEMLYHYEHQLFDALKTKATIKKHTNVLQHIAGYLKKQISKEDKQEIQQAIEQYHAGYVPLIVPITLFKHYFRIYPSKYLENQVYLTPHPGELMLRNHV